MKVIANVPLGFLEQLVANHPEMQPDEKMALAVGMIDGLLKYAVSNLEIRSWQLEVVPSLSDELGIILIADAPLPKQKLAHTRKAIEAMFSDDFQKIEITFTVNAE